MIPPELESSPERKGDMHACLCAAVAVNAFAAQPVPLLVRLHALQDTLACVCTR